MKYGNYNNAAATEDMVDISSGYGSGSSRYSGSRSGDRKNKAMIICIAVAAAFALGVAGFFAFMFFNNNDNKSAAPKTNSAGEFVFSEKTVVSGVDISGKTMREAKELLEGNTSKFVKPIKLSVNIAGTDVVLDESKFEYTYNIDEVLSQVKADAEANKSTAGKDYTVSATVTEESVAGNVESLCEEYNKDAVNAYVSTFNPYSENRFEFKDQQYGCYYPYCTDSDSCIPQSLLVESLRSLDSLCVELLSVNILLISTGRTVVIHVSLHSALCFSVSVLCHFLVPFS